MSKRGEHTQTLFDTVYLASMSKRRTGFIPSVELQQKLHKSRRFVLDPSMSAFLANLSVEAFNVKSVKLRQRAIEAMRRGARLPHRLTWIEYNLREERKRINQLRASGMALGSMETIEKGGKLVPAEQEDTAPDREGWLIEQHEKFETAFRCHLFTSDVTPDASGFNAWAFPWSYVWTSEDVDLPYTHMAPRIFGRGHFGNEYPIPISSVLTGLTGYDTQRVGVQLSPYCTAVEDKSGLVSLLAEWGGVVRRMWALLSTINDIPVTYREVIPSRGFLAGGRIRKYLEYKHVTLHVPQEEYRKLARHVVAIARRRAHTVRGHWRLDHWRPGKRGCQHVFAERDDVCSLCGGHRLWITEHERGDPELGRVVHDYNVEHSNQ